MAIKARRGHNCERATRQEHNAWTATALNWSKASQRSFSQCLLQRPFLHSGESDPTLRHKISIKHFLLMRNTIVVLIIRETHPEDLVEMQR